jgi:hypothetical protein
MFLFLIPTAFSLFFLIFLVRAVSWRRAFLSAAVVLATCVVFVTEFLSVFYAVTRAGVAIAWGAICLIAAAIVLRSSRGDLVASAVTFTNDDAAGPRRSPTTPGFWLLCGVALLFSLVAITAFVGAPNVWDAMEYHLPRMSMWMSNHGVGLYPTPDYCQLIFGPWAEFSMMHTHLLWGSDRFVNFVQVFSFLGSMIGVSYAAKLLGAGSWGQLLAAVISATITEGVLEASGPMNVYALSFWILATVVFLLCFNERPDLGNAVLVGLAAGLALLTKGSAYVYLPFIVLGCWLMGNAKARIEFWKKVPIFLLFIFAVNAMQYWRCYQLTGSPLGMPFPDGGPRLRWMASGFGPRELIANVIRNISLHTVTPLASVNLAVERAMRGLIHAIGMNPDDPRAVWPRFPFELNHFSVHEIHAGNPLHLALVVACGTLLVMNYGKVARKREVFFYAAGLLASFLMFCGMLRWQIWGARHHLPLFVLAAALAGLVLEKFATPRWATAAVVLLLAYALTFSLVNRTRSLIPWSRVADVYQPRSVLYFADQHEDLAANDLALAEAINRLHCQYMAIDSYTALPASEIYSSPHSFFVYPLLALTHVDGRTRFAQYIGVENLSARFYRKTSHSAPCAVLCLNCAKTPRKWAEYQRPEWQCKAFGRDLLFFSEEHRPIGWLGSTN